MSNATETRDVPKVCIDKLLPGEEPYDFQIDPEGEHKKAAALRNKIWTPAGRTLRVRFLDGDPRVQKNVEKAALQWCEYANVKFDFGNDAKAEIRITFTLPGSWSYIGTDCLGIAADQPTMNFGWLTPATPFDEYQRVVLHEFGHALGMIHEHQNPATDIPWNKPAVYEYYEGPPNNWSKEQVDANLFQTYSAEITQFSAFDRNSIMLYPIPNEFTTGDYEVGWNKALSEIDKEFIRLWYPF